MRLIENFNDLLALALMAGIIPALWVLNGLGLVNLGGEVVGASIAVWTLVAQFYFRKSRNK